MMVKILLVTVLFGVATAHFSSSSSESCEDEGPRGGGGGGRPGGRPGGGPRPGRPPGGGNPNAGCDSGWRRLNRPSGGWCVRAFGGVLNQPDAETQCKSYGATLSSLQNMEEARSISRWALSALGKPSGSLWIGARRFPRCRLQPLTATCTALNSFDMTDHSATGLAGFVWSPQQPDNSQSKQDCVIILSARAPVTVKNVVWPVAMLDDVGCHPGVGDTSPRAVSGYVCGKKATQ